MPTLGVGGISTHVVPTFFCKYTYCSVMAYCEICSVVKGMFMRMLKLCQKKEDKVENKVEGKR